MCLERDLRDKPILVLGNKILDNAVDKNDRHQTTHDDNGGALEATRLTESEQESWKTLLDLDDCPHINLRTDGCSVLRVGYQAGLQWLQDQMMMMRQKKKQP